MSAKWTEQQLKAIELRNTSILVSAAAGSGKTAVLVERIIRMIVDEGIPANKFLIVTFTKAAAGELKSRILAAIEKRLSSETNEDERIKLIRQKNLLPLAKISTIDSFCSNLVKENYQLLDISPKFEVMSEDEISLYADKILDDTLESLYYEAEKSNNTTFFDLADLFSNSKDDADFISAIKDLYSNAEAFPFFDQWIDGIVKSYDTPLDAQKSIYVRLYLADLKQKVNYYILKAIKHNSSAIEFCDSSYENYYNTLLSDREIFLQIYSAVKNNDFETIQKLSLSSLSRFPPKKKNDEIDDEEREIIAGLRKNSRESFNKIKQLKFFDEKEFLEEMSILKPLVEELVKTVKTYHENFLKYKIENNKFTFNDILHFSVQLLAKQTDVLNIYAPTPLAESLKHCFEQICIDEFQDTNKAQCILFEMLSDNNLFMVGDVKQSIYRFRKAQPEIFNEIRDTKKLGTGEDVEVLILGNNFRSRKCITETTNFLFNQVMSRETGEVEYCEDEELVQSKEFSPYCESTELHLLEKKSDDDIAEQVEAAYIADLIFEKIEKGYLVQDGETLRKCRPSDFMVLYRNIKKNGFYLVDELRKRNISSYIERKKEFFDSYEISLMLNLIRIIDNPKQDIPLVSVMMSVLYGFYADELAQVRIDSKNKKSDIYTCLYHQCEEKPKIKHFLNELNSWRRTSYSMKTEDFIRKLYDDTEIENFVELMTSPSSKRANLSLLLHYANKYEQSGYLGISGFIRFIDRLKDKKYDLEGSLEKADDNDVVQIMTIHKSKGLQAPIVILADTDRGFNTMDLKKSYIISPFNGIGIKLKAETEDEIPFIKNTFSFNSIKSFENNVIKSEEMRILYVALTRAEEKLIIVGKVKDLSNPEKDSLKSFVDVVKENNKLNSTMFSSISTSYLNWIIPAFLSHPQASDLRTLSHVDDININFDYDFQLEVFINRYIKAIKEESEEEFVDAQINPEMIRIIEEAVNYKYKYLDLTKELSKMAASETGDNSINKSYFAKSKPRFMRKEFSASQKGTLTHKFMQYVDFSAIDFVDDTFDSVVNELDRLVINNVFSRDEADAIDISTVEAFFKSGLAKRMVQSPLLMREKKFTVHFPIDYYKPELDKYIGVEQLTIQGIADAVFEEDGKLVIADYKTDNLKTEEEFIEHYSSQIKTYKEALVQCTDYDEVASMILYSFKLKKAIEVSS